MKLIFKIDKEYDKQMLLEFIPKGNDISNENLAKFFRIDLKEFKWLIAGDNKRNEDLIRICVEDKYKKILPFMKNAVGTYQQSWDAISDDFFGLVEQKVGQKWKFDNYYCVVSAYHAGISSWGGDTIARLWSINPDVQRNVTAHELCLSYFWNIIDDHGVAKTWDEDKKWAYSEILSWCLLGLDHDFYKFWPWTLEKDLFPENHEYPEILPLQRRIKEMYYKFDDFGSFLENLLSMN